MTRIKKKRTRVLRLPDPDGNPFCAERQIEDIFSEITGKPKMVEDLDSKPPPIDPKFILPTSVFAPEREILERRWAGQKISEVPSDLEHVLKATLSTGPKDELEAWTLPGQDNDEDDREEYKPPEVEQEFVRHVPKVDARVITFGHRPGSASRHFDPLTMSSSNVQYKRKGKRLPRVGLLSSHDLHAMLGQAAADFKRGSRSRAEDSEDSTGGPAARRKQMGQSQSAVNIETTVTAQMETPKLTTNSEYAAANGGLDANSTTMSLATGMTPSKLRMSASQPVLGPGGFASATSLVNPNEFEQVKAPSWLGGVYAVGGGRSLFNGRKEDKRRPKKKTPEKPNFDNKIYYPPPQRAFKSELLQDDIAGLSSKDRIRKYTKLSAGAIITPVCEERQYSDMLEARDIETRIFKSAGTENKNRVYQKKTIIHSLTPRKTFSHDMNEIRRTVRYQEKLEQEQRDLEEEERAWKEANGIVDGEEGEEAEEEGSDREGGVEEDVVGEDGGDGPAENASEFYDDGMVGEEGSEGYVEGGSDMIDGDSLGIIDATDSLSLDGGESKGMEGDEDESTTVVAVEEKKTFASTV
jgi:hypothetical protein